MLGEYEIEGRLTVSYELADDEKIDNHYNFKTESNFPVYLSCESFSVLSKDVFKRHSFYKLHKENKRTLIYRMTRTVCFNQ